MASHRAAPPQSAPDEIWRDVRGEILAKGWTDSRSGVLHFPGLGCYRFSESGPVTAEIEPGAPETALTGTYWKSVVPFVLQARGYEALHASAILTGTGVVAFCAVSETGKSTLGRALVRRGHRAWADDAVLLDGARALPLPFQVKLRRESAEWFGEADLSPFHEPEGEHPLRAVFLLERGDDSSVTARRLAPAAAFPQLLRHAFCFALSAAKRKHTMISRYLDLASSVPVFELRFPSGLEHLDTIAATVGDALGRLD